MPNPLGLAGAIAATTIDNYGKTIADNISKSNALLSRLRKKGKSKPFSGGKDISQELSYQENVTYTRYSGYEVINTSPSDTITSAKYKIKQAAVSVTSSGLDVLQNAGPEAIHDLVKERVDNAQKTLANRVSEDIYSDGSADQGRQINGLQSLISKTPSIGVVGGIDAAAYPFWRNVAINANILLGATPTDKNINKVLNQMFLQCHRGADGIDLAVADTNFYSLVLEYHQDKARVTSAEFDDLGFENIKYRNADIVLDGGYGGSAPLNTCYGLNTDHIHFRPHKDRNFTRIGDERMTTNQDATVALIGFAGNMTCSNRFLQGVCYYS